MRTPLIAALALLAGCVGTEDAGGPGPEAATTAAASSSAGPTQASSSGGEQGSTGEGTGSSTTFASSVDTSGDGSTQTSTGSTAADVLVRTTFTIPAGTVVEEFDYAADGTAPAERTAGRSIVVAIRDLTHPDREQSRLCPGDHPLNGCATVDYGAFGTTHDNHLAVDGASGPVALHLYKSREIVDVAEPLGASE